jgi:methylglyoxal synthase
MNDGDFWGEYSHLGGPPYLLVRLIMVSWGGVRQTAVPAPRFTEVTVEYQDAPMSRRKRIALVAHDHKKEELIGWAKRHRDALARHELIATGTTGVLLEKEAKLTVEKVRSGPLGGDLEIGALIAQGEIDCLIFFWDPLAAQPHDPDVRALLRIAVVWNIPAACDLATADFILTSPYMDSEYRRLVPDYEEKKRKAWPLKGG